MRIRTRLQFTSRAALTGLVLAVAGGTWSFLAFRRAKAAAGLADKLRTVCLESNGYRDHYALYPAERVHAQWLNHHALGTRLLEEAQARFRDPADRRALERMRRDWEEAGALFRRLDQAKAMAGAPEVLAELEKRLVTQMLLRGAAFAESAAALENRAEAEAEAGYRRMAWIFGLFSVTLATAILVQAGQLRRMLDRRLAPLHEGVRRVAEGNLDFRLDMPADDEFGDLAAAVDAMTDRLQVSTARLGEEIGRRQLAEAAKRSEARFRAWFDLPIIGIATSSPDRGLLEVNDHFCAMLGYAREEVLGRDWAALTHPDDLGKDLDRQAQVLAGKAEGYTLEKRFLRKDGSVLETELALRCVRLPDGGVDYFVALVLDITERKEAEFERHRMTAQLQQAQKMDSLGSLAGGVAHDMNNVLGAILGLASAHLELHPDEGPERAAFVTIARAAERGRDLVKSLLRFSRKSLAEERNVDLNALLADEARLLERTTLAKVRLRLELAPDLPPVRGDASALAHAVMNLCVNAVDAMPGGGTLTLGTGLAPDGQVEVRVEDDGAGMPREVLERALDPFFTTKEVGQGTGLGLSLVYSTVKAHRGVLDLRSEPGRGTRVRMVFPPAPPEPEAGAPGSVPAEVPGRPLRILVVDDDDLVQHATRQLLEVLGHATTAAASGEEALALVEAGLEADAVILDMNMPGLGGAQTLPRLRGLRPDLPVLLATGRVDQAALGAADAFPRVALLAKPFSKAEVEAGLARLCGPA